MTTDQLSWSDSSGDKWNAAITLVAALRLRDTQQIDLLDPKSMETLFGVNPLLRVEAIAELAREQWEGRSLDYKAFAERLLSPGAFPKATAALRAAISDFFRRLDRNDLAIVSDRAWEAMEADRQMREAEAASDSVGVILEAAQRKGKAQMKGALQKALDEITKLPITGTESGD
jgi:hypothetical protein